jgi:hypothetical protein
MTADYVKTEENSALEKSSVKYAARYGQWLK